MRKIKKNLITSLIFFTMYANCSAQFGFPIYNDGALIDRYNIGRSKIILKTGDVNEFKITEKIKIEVVYTSMKVAEFNSEEEYIKKKRDKIEKKEGEAKADEWQKTWDSAKSVLWPQKFADSYNEKMARKKINSKLKLGDTIATKTLIINVNYIDPGYNVFVSSRPAYVNFEFKLFDNSDLSKPIAELSVNNVAGVGGADSNYDFDGRVGDAFINAASMLSKFIIRGK